MLSTSLTHVSSGLFRWQRLIVGVVLIGAAAAVLIGDGQPLGDYVGN